MGIIIQQIVTMPIYGKEALNICHPTWSALQIFFHCLFGGHFEKGGSFSSVLRKF